MLIQEAVASVEEVFSVSSSYFLLLRFVPFRSTYDHPQFFCTVLVGYIYGHKVQNKEQNM